MVINFYSRKPTSMNTAVMQTEEQKMREPWECAWLLQSAVLRMVLSNLAS